MPVRNLPGGNYRVSCSGCGTSIDVQRIARDERVYGANHYGANATDVFGWLATTNRFRSRCNTCMREARRAYARNTRTAPRSTGAAAPTVTVDTAALGLARTFGIEIECIFRPGRDVAARALADAGYSDWRVKYDGSLTSGGMEVVSPVLSGEAGVEAIRGVTRVLRNIGATVNRSCGLHVHHGIRDLDVDGVKRAARAWSRNQGIIDGLVSPSRRNGANSYCRPLSGGDLGAIENATTLRQIETLRLDRYRTFNLAAYGRYGTVEIRQHQGTLDAEKIISWMRLGQGILDTAKAGVEASTAATVRDMFRGLGSRLDETARTFLTGRAVEFGAVGV